MVRLSHCQLLCLCSGGFLAVRAAGESWQRINGPCKLCSPNDLWGWWINSPVPSVLCWGNSEAHVLHCFPEFPSGFGLQLPTGVVGLIMYFNTLPEEGNGNPLQYSGLENPMDREAPRKKKKKKKKQEPRQEVEEKEPVGQRGPAVPGCRPLPAVNGQAPRGPTGVHGTRRGR